MAHGGAIISPPRCVDGALESCDDLNRGAASFPVAGEAARATIRLSFSPGLEALGGPERHWGK